MSRNDQSFLDKMRGVSDPLEIFTIHHVHGHVQVQVNVQVQANVHGQVQVRHPETVSSGVLEHQPLEGFV